MPSRVGGSIATTFPNAPFTRPSDVLTFLVSMTRADASISRTSTRSALLPFLVTAFRCPPSGFVWESWALMMYGFSVIVLSFALLWACAAALVAKTCNASSGSSGRLFLNCNVLESSSDIDSPFGCTRILFSISANGLSSFWRMISSKYATSNRSCQMSIPFSSFGNSRVFARTGLSWWKSPTARTAKLPKWTRPHSLDGIFMIWFSLPSMCAKTCLFIMEISSRTTSLTLCSSACNVFSASDFKPQYSLPTTFGIFKALWTVLADIAKAETPVLDMTNTALPLGMSPHRIRWASLTIAFKRNDFPQPPGALKCKWKGLTGLCNFTSIQYWRTKYRTCCCFTLRLEKVERTVSPVSSTEQTDWCFCGSSIKSGISDSSANSSSSLCLLLSSSILCASVSGAIAAQASSRWPFLRNWSQASSNWSVLLLYVDLCSFSISNTGLGDCVGFSFTAPSVQNIW